jgi:predicted AlkP superfamily pyrophosphatase or phosphodiesterase
MTLRRTAVLNVVGLTDSLLGPATPRLSALRQKGRRALIRPVLPALTCSAQATYLTGTPPSAHGIVANGWYNRELAEVQFWKQSNHLVHGPKVWETLRECYPGFTCAKLFWWYNMYSSADWSMTPRPIYPADGRKVFDIYTSPLPLRTEVKQSLGEFPFPTFWGPAAGVDTPQGRADAASRWIAGAARWTEERYQPSLSLVYLPHLDYNLQRLGPTDPRIHADLAAIDAIAGELIDFFQSRNVTVLVLSEYGITPVEVPVHLNRLFRKHGWLTTKEELGLELLDAGASRVFAVADHQIAHIYVNDPSLESRVREVVAREPGVGQVLGAKEKSEAGLAHARSGELIALAQENAWFTYYYWDDERRAPDFARCVDIHRKPGYDPVELFLDPALAFPKLKIGWRLLRKKLGFRMLMDVIPLDATLVKGSHGICPASTKDYPILISEDPELIPHDILSATEVCGVIERCTKLKVEHS